MTDNVNLRAVVLDILLEVNEKGAYSHIVMNGALDKYQYLDKTQRSFITRLAEGTIEKTTELDYIINSFSNTKVRKMKPLIRNILRMSVYQLKYMSQVPASAACNEAVKLMTKRGFSGLKGFVNGVLRNISRGLDTIEYPDRKKDIVQYLSVVYSCPDWIIEKWLKVYDESVIQSILEGFNEDRHTYARCNRSVVSPEQLKASLEQEGVVVEETEYVNYAFEIKGYDYIGDMKSFQNGEFQIQDISSIIAGVAVDVKSTDYVIDVCAAPGGKCLHIADKISYEWNKMGSMGEKGHVDARDLTPLKVNLIEQNIERLKTDNISVKVYDAREVDEDVIGKADIVLADLPCSGLGIMGRKGDIKYKMTSEKQEDLVILQREILSTIWQYVKPGGILIYSTCTINEDENINNVRWFTNEYPFELKSIDNLEWLKEKNAGEPDTLKDGYIQLLPGVHGTDGFFISKMIRKN